MLHRYCYAKYKRYGDAEYILCNHSVSLGNYSDFHQSLLLVNSKQKPIISYIWSYVPYDVMSM